MSRSPKHYSDGVSWCKLILHETCRLSRAHHASTGILLEAKTQTYRSPRLAIGHKEDEPNHRAVDLPVAVNGSRIPSVTLAFDALALNTYNHFALGFVHQQPTQQHHPLFYFSSLCSPYRFRNPPSLYTSSLCLSHQTSSSATRLLFVTNLPTLNDSTS